MPKTKQKHHYDIYLAIAVVVVVILSTIGLRQPAHAPGIEGQTRNLNPTVLEERSNQILLTMQEGEIDKLSEFAHLAKGIRFSPYPHVLPEQDLVFSAAELEKISSDNTKHLWGFTDGRGTPIKLTFTEYYQNYIYDQDYINAPEIGENEIISHGLMLENLEEVYPDAEYVEYYFPGFEEEMGGMDWRSIRLVYEKVGEVWYLVGIIHGEWTI